MTIAAALLFLASGAAQASAEPPPIDKSGYTLFDPTPAAAMRDFNTDRPDTTESPYTVDAGHVQIELSLVDYARDGRTRGFDALPVNLKLGLTNSVDIQFVLTPYQHIETAGKAADGFCDSQIRLKINLWGNDSGGTAFALMPFVKLPTAANGLGNGHGEGGLILPLAVDLPHGFSLGTMAEFDLVYDDDARDYGVDIVHSATLGHALVGDLSGYLEYVGTVPRAGRYQAVASGGLTYPLRPNWIVDGGGTLGMAGAVDDLTAFVGTSLRF